MLHSDLINDSLETLIQRFTVTIIDKVNREVAEVKEPGLRENHASTPETFGSCADETNEELINSHCCLFPVVDLSMLDTESSC